MEDKELCDFLGMVNDARSLLTFVAALEKDRRKAALAEKNHPSSPYDPDAHGWESISIENFLESARGWAEDTDFGLSQGLPKDNLWCRFANFLYAGKFYE